MSNKKHLTDEEIKAKKEELANLFTEKAKNKEDGTKRKSPATDFLLEIKDTVKQAIESNLSYKEIAESIYTIYSFKVSQQTIRAFANTELGVPINHRKKVSPIGSPEPVKDKVFIDAAATPEKLSVKEQRRANAEKAREGNKS